MDDRRPTKLVLSKDTLYKLNPKTVEDAELRAAKGGAATDGCVDLSLLTDCCVSWSCRTCTGFDCA